MATFTWTGSASNNAWGDPDNWSPNAVPSNGDSIIINNGDNVLCYQGAGVSTVLGSVFVSSTSTLSAYGGIHATFLTIDGTISGGGTLYIGPLSTLEAGSGVSSADGAVVVFGTYQWGGAGSSQSVTLNAGAHFNFSTQFDGTIDERGTDATTIAYNGAGVVSNITIDGQTATFVTSAGNYALNFAADLDPSAFVLDAATGTIVVCLVTGTLVRTTRGDIPVEDLRIGDVAVTASSQLRPIRWIGSTELECGKAANPRKCWPIRIAAGAMGPDKPSHDLIVSPAHGICVTVVTDVLMPASVLVNGATIDHVECAKVTYWHVELDEHDILVTNGLPTESYVDHGNRSFFSQTMGASIQLVNDHEQRCLTYVSDGPLIEAVRMQIHARALDMGWTLSDDPFADIHLIADGQRIDPMIDEGRAEFRVRSSVSELWLASEWGAPNLVSSSGDGRRLGVCFSRLVIEDGVAEPRHIFADDNRLNDGFHYVEDGRRRWTAGRAHLPSSLWEGYGGILRLTFEFAGPAVPRWIPPQSSEEPAIERDQEQAA